MAPAQLPFSHTVGKPGLCWGWKECPGAQPSGYTVSLPHAGTASAWCQVGPETTERGFPVGTLGSAVHAPRALPVPTGPCTAAGLPSLLSLQPQVLQQEQPWCWTGDKEGAATSGRGALVATSPALGLSTQFPEGFVCELAPVDRCILPPPPGLARPLHGLLSL